MEAGGRRLFGISRLPSPAGREIPVFVVEPLGLTTPHACARDIAF
jgi:hypothetical protein